MFPEPNTYLCPCIITECSHTWKTLVAGWIGFCLFRFGFPKRVFPITSTSLDVVYMGDCSLASHTLLTHNCPISLQATQIECREEEIVGVILRTFLPLCATSSLHHILWRSCRGQFLTMCSLSVECQRVLSATWLLTRSREISPFSHLSGHCSTFEWDAYSIQQQNGYKSQTKGMIKTCNSTVTSRSFLHTETLSTCELHLSGMVYEQPNPTIGG